MEREAYHMRNAGRVPQPFGEERRSIQISLINLSEANHKFRKGLNIIFLIDFPRSG